MVASIRGYTPNYSFKLVNFDTPRWHTLEYANWTQLDSLLLQAGIPANRGDWQQGTTYFEGDRVFDPEDGVLYRCLVTHTSASTGTFAQDRLAHPTYWAIQTIGVPLWRGVWAPIVTYVLGDLVVVDAYQYYLCISNHMSGSTFPPDAGNWTLVFDATAAVNATNASAVAAAGSATAAAGSATEAGTYATNSANSAAESLSHATDSANSATASAGSATAAGNSATAAAGSATAADASADAAAASAIVAAEQASKLFGTSTTSMAIGLGTQVFTTQADKYFNVGKFLMIRSNADPINFWEYGQVTAYSGTVLTMNILASAGIGTFANWIIDVSAVGGVGGASVVTQDTPPTSAVDGDMWHETDTGKTFIYIVDASGPPGQWVQQSSLAQGPSNTVSTAVDQNLSEVQQVQARKNIAAAPFDALAYNGMQFNGSMEVRQESGITPVNIPYNIQKYASDGFAAVLLGATRVGTIRSAALSTLPGFSSCTNLDCTTPAALAAGDAQYIFHPIEGIRWSRLAFGSSNARPVTVAFWIYSSVAGTMAVSIRNAANTRSYVTDVVINAANMWEYKAVTIPGCTDGTWATDNTLGGSVSFVFGAGSTYRTTANAWSSTTMMLATPATTNFWAAASSVYITGVILLPGIEAPTAAQSSLIMRPYDQELFACMRYYEKVNGELGTKAGGWGAMYSSTQSTIWTPFKVIKRAIPTITPPTGTYYIANIGGAAVGNPVNAQGTLSGCTWDGVNHPSTPIGVPVGFNGFVVADARL